MNPSAINSILASGAMRVDSLGERTSMRPTAGNGGLWLTIWVPGSSATLALFSVRLGQFWERHACAMCAACGQAHRDDKDKGVAGVDSWPPPDRAL